MTAGIITRFIQSVGSLPSFLLISSVILNVISANLHADSVNIHAEIYTPGADQRMNLDRFQQMENHIKDHLADRLHSEQWVDFNDTHGGLWLEHHYPQAMGTLILVHGAEQTPIWPHLLEPIRQFMPKFGWNTLSVLLDIEQTTPIIDQAFTYLASREAAEPWAVLLHKESVFKLLGPKVLNPTSPAFAYEQVKGIILLDALLPKDSFHSVHQGLFEGPLSEFTFPLLDLITQPQRQDIIVQAKDRFGVWSKRSKGYQQWLTPVPISLDEVEDKRIAGKIRGWLRRHVRKQQKPVLSEKFRERKQNREFY